MRKLANWLVGFALGSSAAAVIVALFVPQSGAEIRLRLREGYREALEEARKASATRRAELEAQLLHLQDAD